MVRREPLIPVPGCSPLEGRGEKGFGESCALEDFFRQDPQQLGLPTTH
jgi:hypothetical protein